MDNSNDFEIALRVLNEWCKIPLPQYTVMGFRVYCEKNQKVDHTECEEECCHPGDKLRETVVCGKCGKEM